MIWQVQIGDGSNFFFLWIMPGASLKLPSGPVCTRGTARVTGDCREALNYVWSMNYC